MHSPNKCSALSEMFYDSEGELTYTSSVATRKLKHQTFLVPRTPTGSIFAACQDVLELRSRTSKREFSGHGLQNVSSQAETRGLNSGFFKEYSSYKSKHSSSEIMFSSKERNKSLKDIFK